MSNKSLLSLISLVILNCTGAGMIAMPSILEKFGINAFPSWIFTAIGALSIGIIFVKLAEYLNKEGIHEIVAGPFDSGIHKFLKAAVFYSYLVFSIIGNAAIAMVLVEGISYFLPYSGFEMYVFIFSIVLITNIFGSNTSKMFNQFLAVLKILILVVIPILVYLLCVDNPSSIRNGGSPFTDIPKCMFLTLWPFLGIESIMMEKDVDVKVVRRGIILGIILCLSIYVANTYIIMSTFPSLQNIQSPYASLFEMLFPRWVLSFSIIVIGIGSLHGWTHTTISSYKGGNDITPRFLNQKNKYNVSIAPLLASFIFPLITIFISKFYLKNGNAFEIVITVCTSLILFIYLFAIISLIYLFFKRKKYDFEGIICIAIGSIYLTFAFIGSPLLLNIISFGFFALCGLIYVVCSRKS
jgi:amino acid transporter